MLHTAKENISNITLQDVSKGIVLPIFFILILILNLHNLIIFKKLYYYQILFRRNKSYKSLIYTN